MDYFIIDSEGRKRKAIQKTCLLCSELYLVPCRFEAKSQFCSKVCSSKSRENKEKLQCRNCGKQFNRVVSKKSNSRYGIYFCSRICKDQAQQVESGVDMVKPQHYNTGESVYRKKALRNYGEKCMICGFDNEVKMLDVHHIDGNRKNGLLNNLQVLCVWCHAKITRGVK